MATPAIHWFRRDLRLDDNPSLETAAKSGGGIIPVFVARRPEPTDDVVGPHRRAHAAGALIALRDALRARGSDLLLLAGDPVQVIPELARRVGAGVVTAEQDVTPAARRRDEAVAAALAADGRHLTLGDGLLLTSPAELLTGAGGPYTVYSPFRRRVEGLIGECGLRPAASVQTAALMPAAMLQELRTDGNGEDLATSSAAPSPAPDAGSDAARRRLVQFIDDRATRYADERDQPARPTSRLSADLHFGTISVRDAYDAALNAHRATASPNEQRGIGTWIAQLIWRDFYHHILWHFPHVANSAFIAKFDGLRWSDDDDHFAAWSDGRTGYPIIDAAMRQLLATGWMHNRCRMLVASFLTKDLHIDWRRGEALFMRHLIDADVANNNGGWQWSASTGTDPQPYFRIFNPTLQANRHDPSGEYVRTWVPELRRVPDALLHEPWRADAAVRGDYPPPIVDHHVERSVALAEYQRVSREGSAAPPVTQA